MSEWAARYIGIPFCSDGSSFAGCHCWGLVRLVYQRELKIELPAYGECSAGDLIKASRRFKDDSRAGPWLLSLGDHRPFDVVLMTGMTDEERPRRVPGHVGVLISSDRVLHVEKAIAASHMPLDHPRIRHRILSFHRHEQLA